MTFSTRLSKVLFPKKSVKMIGGNEKRKRQLVFELQSSRVFEKRSNKFLRKGLIASYRKSLKVSVRVTFFTLILLEVVLCPISKHFVSNN